MNSGAAKHAVTSILVALIYDGTLLVGESLDECRTKPGQEYYFTGLTMPEATAALGISLRSAQRNWTYFCGRYAFDSGVLHPRVEG